MRGRGVEVLAEEFLNRGPFALAINATTPGADAQELFEVPQSFQSATGR